MAQEEEVIFSLVWSELFLGQDAETQIGPKWLFHQRVSVGEWQKNMDGMHCITPDELGGNYVSVNGWMWYVWWNTLSDRLDKCYAKQATVAEKKHDWERNTSQPDFICVLNKPLA